MTWLITGLCCISAVEILLRTGVFNSLNRISLMCSRALQIISRKKVSDHWKEKALLGFARNILTTTLRLMLALLLVFSPFIAAIYLTAALGIKLDDFLASVEGLAGATLIAALYGLARRVYAGL